MRGEGTIKEEGLREKVWVNCERVERGGVSPSSESFFFLFPSKFLKISFTFTSTNVTGTRKRSSFCYSRPKLSGENKTGDPRRFGLLLQCRGKDEGGGAAEKGAMQPPLFYPRRFSRVGGGGGRPTLGGATNFKALSGARARVENVRGVGLMIAVPKLVVFQTGGSKLVLFRDPLTFTTPRVRLKKCGLLMFGLFFGLLAANQTEIE